MNAKLKAIIAHFWWIGWVIALVININEKEEFASFYIRQTLGLWIASVAVSILWTIPLLGWLAGTIGIILLFVLWLMSLISAISGEMKEVPWIGHYFQDWFRTL
jgi:uncharacterized membrane protein